MYWGNLWKFDRGWTVGMCGRLTENVLVDCEEVGQRLYCWNVWRLDRGCNGGMCGGLAEVVLLECVEV